MPWRMRALFRSMPPTQLLPTREASGRHSSISSDSMGRRIAAGYPRIVLMVCRSSGVRLRSQGLKYPVHVATDLEHEVATVFDLIVGVLLAEAAALLLVEVKGEAHTAVSNARRLGSTAL